MSANDLHAAALECLLSAEADRKLAVTDAVAEAWRGGELSLGGSDAPLPLPEPGRPAALKLVRPRDLPRRHPGSPEGHAGLIHALAHIEFNAINLAWDAVYRFRGLPDAFYDDWVRVAAEEAYHFSLLRDHLRELGIEYGDFPGHNGLWEMAEKTAHDPLIRMALVPRCLEARGLDVSPAIQAKLKAVGDTRAVAILDIILRDEIGHVAIGDRWYRHLCEQRQLEPENQYRHLLDQYMSAPPRPPFHRQARRQAGFSEAELTYLEQCG